MFVEIVDNEKIINVRLPISKSYAIRYAMAALLADDIETLEIIAKEKQLCDDIKNTLAAIYALIKDDILFCYESALLLRTISLLAPHYINEIPIYIFIDDALKNRLTEDLQKILNITNIKYSIETKKIEEIKNEKKIEENIAKFYKLEKVFLKIQENSMKYFDLIDDEEKNQSNLQSFSNLCEETRQNLEIKSKRNSEQINDVYNELKHCQKILNNHELLNENNKNEKCRKSKILEDVFTSFKAIENNLPGNKEFTFLKLYDNIKSGTYEIDASKTSQLLSGLLMSLPICEGDSVIDVINLNSKSYVDLTIDVMRHFGVNIICDKYQRFYISGGQSYVPAKNISIELDWSAAANFLVLGAIRGGVCIEGLNFHSKQPDKRIYDFFLDIDINMELKNDTLILYKSVISGFNFNAIDTPDLIPPLIVLALNAQQTCYIQGISRLVYKESNRRDAILQEFSKLGAKIEIDLENDRFIVNPSKLQGGEVFSHNDHRIAMALAIAGMNAKGKVKIQNSECVSKSYPNFWTDLGLIQTI